MADYYSEKQSLFGIRKTLLKSPSGISKSMENKALLAVQGSVL